MSLELNPNSGLAFRNDRGLERSDKAPQFKGKSKKKKQEMAIAAYLDAQEDK